ncbi:MAG: hypothetical protein MZV70_01245 [Desulfobacterales bacterium]|nr:hypothetical protein [Desulfobacterales bacterium]
MDLLSHLLSYVNLAGAVHALIQALVLALTRRGSRLANQHHGPVPPGAGDRHGQRHGRDPRSLRHLAGPGHSHRPHRPGL